jgi:hypothetical protein
MRGSVPPLPSTPSWRGAQFKKTQAQFYFYLTFTTVSRLALGPTQPPIVGTGGSLPGGKAAGA